MVSEIEHVRRQIAKWRQETLDWGRLTPRPKPPPEDLLQEAARRSPPDITVIVGDRRFRCRAAVLAALSPALRPSARVGAALRLPTLHVRAQAFQSAYEWMVLSEWQAPGDMRGTLELLSAARHLRLDGLAALCADDLRRDASLAEHRALQALVGARRIAGCRLDAVLLPKVRGFFLPLASTRYFLRLSAGEVAALLTSSHLRVHGELEVLFVAVRWLKHDWPSRRQHVPALTRHVRFGRMSLVDLTALRHARRNPHIGHVVRQPYVQRLVADGLSGLVLRLQGPAADGDHLQGLAAAVGCEMPPPRDYYDEGRCPSTYSEFLADLETHHKNLPAEWPVSLEPPPLYDGPRTVQASRPTSDSRVHDVSTTEVLAEAPRSYFAASFSSVGTQTEVADDVHHADEMYKPSTDSGVCDVTTPSLLTEEPRALAEDESQPCFAVSFSSICTQTEVANDSLEKETYFPCEECNCPAYFYDVAITYPARCFCQESL